MTAEILGGLIMLFTLAVVGGFIAYWNTKSGAEATLYREPKRNINSPDNVVSTAKRDRNE